jgi:uncharacterized protein with HEPN domain
MRQDIYKLFTTNDKFFPVWETIETNFPQLKRQLLSIKK